MVYGIQHFQVFVIVSFAAFVAILWFTTRKRVEHLAPLSIIAIAGVIVVGGMIFAKYGQNIGLPWWVYYTAPAFATLVLPPVVFRFSRAELWEYLMLAFFSSPLIHVAFSLLLDWHEYMPFIPIPSLRALFGGGIGI